MFELVESVIQGGEMTIGALRASYGVIVAVQAIGF